MKSYIVLGLGRFGKSMAKALCDMGHEVLAVDDDAEIVNNFAKHVTHAVQANVTDEDFLKDMDVSKFDAAIVAVGSNMQVGIMATVLLKELGARYILVKAQDEFEEKILYKVGADKVILPETDMGIKAAHNLVSGNFFEALENRPSTASSASPYRTGGAANPWASFPSARGTASTSSPSWGRAARSSCRTPLRCWIITWF